MKESKRKVRNLEARIGMLEQVAAFLLHTVSKLGDPNIAEEVASINFQFEDPDDDEDEG